MWRYFTTRCDFMWLSKFQAWYDLIPLTYDCTPDQVTILIMCIHLLLDGDLWSVSLSDNRREYICNICHQTFNFIHVMKRHSLTHTGEKPYSCDYCGRSFTNLYNLKTHCLIHTGEKPFRCEICGKPFRRKQHLMGHMLVHLNKCITRDDKVQD